MRARRTVSAQGEIYTGLFEIGERHCDVALKLADGGVYIGRFEHGVMSGLGQFDGLAGRCAGQFSGGNPNGNGSFVSADGTLMQGLFRDGSPDGRVLVTRPSQLNRTTSFDDGQP